MYQPVPVVPPVVITPNKNLLLSAAETPHVSESLITEIKVMVARIEERQISLGRDRTMPGNMRLAVLQTKVCKIF